MRLLPKAKTSFSAHWLHLVSMHRYSCPYMIPAFWGIVWVMVLVTVGKCYFYDDHQNKSMYKNRHRVVTLFFLRSRHLFINRRTEFPNYMAAKWLIFLLLLIITWMWTFGIEMGAISYPWSSPHFSGFLNLLGYCVLYIFIRKYC